MNIFILTVMMILQTSPAAIRGLLTKSGSGEPVAGATVELRRADQSEPLPRSATTARDGSFVLSGIPAGKYELTASKAGFVRATFGEQKPGGAGIPLTVPSEFGVLRLTLTPAAVISGRIRDSRGQPLANANVSALRLSFSQGRQSLAEVQTTVTDDLGEYRLFYLTPGRYYVGATPTTISGRGVGAGARTDPITDFRAQRENVRTKAVPTEEIDAATYFPGTTDPLAALPLDLKAGQESSDVDIVTSPVRSYHIRGTITASDPGFPDASGTFSGLTGSATLRLSTRQSSRVTGSRIPDFDMSGVLSGTYILAATVGNLTGKTSIEVLNADLNNVVIPISRAFSASGRVVVEGAGAENPGPDIKTLRVSLTSEPFDGMFMNPPNPAADGSFTVNGLTAGTYRVSLNPPMQNGYLKSYRLGTAEGIANGITFHAPPDVPLVITISAHPGRIEGHVINDRNEAVPNAIVALVPETSLRGRTELYRNAGSSPTGEFKLQGIVPGNYKLFAWQEVENGAWLNAEFLRAYENKGRPVVIAEDSAESIDLRAIAP
jgi:hypothetical protein